MQGRAGISTVPLDAGIGRRLRTSTTRSSCRCTSMKLTGYLAKRLAWATVAKVPAKCTIRALASWRTASPPGWIKSRFRLPGRDLWGGERVT